MATPNVTHFPTPHTQPVFTGRPLASKLARVLSDVHRVPKNGRNDFHKYDYVTESDLVDHIRDKLAEHGVAIFPSVREHDVIEMEDQRKRTVYLTTVTLEISLVDGESGDTMTTTWIGQGLDQSDKGYYKAYTGAMKYFLMKTFMISTGDDPEQDDVSREPAKMSHADTFVSLLDEVADKGSREQFVALYVSRMKAQKLDDIDSSKVGAMCRKLKAMSNKERLTYINGVITDFASKKKSA
jgi:hypothetical protein